MHKAGAGSGAGFQVARIVAILDVNRMCKGWWGGVGFQPLVEPPLEASVERASLISRAVDQT